jgi:hypothetical protein
MLGGGGEGDVSLRSSSAACLARAASFASPVMSSCSISLPLPLSMVRPLIALSGSGEEDNTFRSVTSMLISMSGLGGARGRELEAPDIALPGRRGPTRVANGASSESESDEEFEEVSLSEDCSFFEETLHQIKSPCQKLSRS